jgi:hypothetical protein
MTAFGASRRDVADGVFARWAGHQIHQDTRAYKKPICPNEK